eukprot:11737040-Ditylum_brightwellii.AAC.1
MGIVQFGMKSTLIQFPGQYYVYHGAAKEGEVAEEDVALVIGAYESAFLMSVQSKQIQRSLLQGWFSDTDWKMDKERHPAVVKKLPENSQ